MNLAARTGVACALLAATAGIANAQCRNGDRISVRGIVGQIMSSYGAYAFMTNVRTTRGCTIDYVFAVVTNVDDTCRQGAQFTATGRLQQNADGWAVEADSIGCP